LTLFNYTNNSKHIKMADEEVPAEEMAEEVEEVAEMNVLDALKEVR
jgi:hypothetical protein